MLAASADSVQPIRIVWEVHLTAVLSRGGIGVQSDNIAMNGFCSEAHIWRPPSASWGDWRMECPPAGVREATNEGNFSIFWIKPVRFDLSPADAAHVNRDDCPVAL
jgi:hypothetical protein